MSQITQPFSLQVLSSFHNVRQFLSGQSSIEFLKKESANPLPIIHGHRWSCIYKLTRPLLHICTVFLARIAFCLNHWNAQGIAKSASQLKDKIASICIDQSLPDRSIARQQGIPCLLVATINSPAPGAEDVSCHPSISHDKIPDPRVRKRTLKDPVCFDPYAGTCRGTTFWFLYLYLQTRALFNDPQQHIISLGRLFAIGAPKEAVLLQSLYIKKGKLLNVRIGTLDHPGERHPIATIPQDNTRSIHEAAAKATMQNLPPGAYYVSFVGRHACSYIKIHPSLGFFFDPNKGIYQINGTAQGEQLFLFFQPDYLNQGHGIKIYPVYNRGSF